MRALIGHHIEKRMIPARALKEGLAIRARYDRGELSYGESSLKSLIIWAGYLAGQNYDRLVADARDFFDSNSGIFYPYFPNCAPLTAIRMIFIWLLPILIFYLRRFAMFFRLMAMSLPNFNLRPGFAAG